MAALGATAVIPGHGDPLVGADALREELTSMSRYLRVIVDHALRGLNDGELPDRIVETLRIPEELRRHPRLQAVYDQPEFICRNVIRRYSGWWDGHPSHLLPASQDDQAAEIARLAGGVEVLVARAQALAASDPRLACHLAEWAFLADRDDPAAQDCYREVFEARAGAQPGLMAQVNLRISAAWTAAARRRSDG